MIYWLWLNNISGLGPVLSKALLKKYITPVRIYKCTEDELLSIKGIGNKLAKAILNKRCLKKEKSQFYNLNKNKIKILTYSDRRYPNQAKAYSKSPILLYYRGTIKYNTNNIAIIGNESYTPYSEIVTINAAMHLLKANYTLITGLSKGIESLAHNQFYSNSSYQIAFVPHGLDVYYPARNIQLIKKVIENGAVISEHPLGTKPINAFFLKKNDLIASWSNKILLIEAHKKAHTLGIIKTAKKLSKPIFVVPQELYNKNAEASNQILCDSGLLYLNPFQLTPDYIPKVSTIIEVSLNSNSDETRVLKALISKEKTIDELAFDLQLSSLKIIEIITILELESQVIKLPGIKYKLV